MRGRWKVEWNWRNWLKIMTEIGCKRNMTDVVNGMFEEKTVRFGLIKTQPYDGRGAAAGKSKLFHLHFGRSMYVSA